MKSVVAAAALVTVAVAQSNPLIPSGISDGCTQFLNKLNTDTSMSTCLQSITTATSAFGPKANGTASATDVNSALSQLCSSTSCDDSTLRSQLAGFYSACQAELVTSPNAQVLTQYDSLYSLAPMKDALCIKQNGQYCVQTLNNASSPASSRKRAESQVVIVPSASTYAQKNIAFLQLSASSPQSILCSDCSKAVQQSWISSMNAAAYAPGLPNSQLLSGWSGLYNGTLQTCGASFLDTSTNNAGNGALNSGVFGASSAAVPEAAAASSVLGMLGALAFAVFAL